MKDKMKKLANVEVTIYKIGESHLAMSNSLLIWLEMMKINMVTLNYQCFQTKHLDKKKGKCLEHAWFSASMVARFCGLSSMEEVNLKYLTDEETEIVKKVFIFNGKLS